MLLIVPSCLLLEASQGHDLEALQKVLHVTSLGTHTTRTHQHCPILPCSPLSAASPLSSLGGDTVSSTPGFTPPVIVQDMEDPQLGASKFNFNLPTPPRTPQGSVCPLLAR